MKIIVIISTICAILVAVTSILTFVFLKDKDYPEQKVKIDWQIPITYAVITFFMIASLIGCIKLIVEIYKLWT
jgi:hypothetical protein